MDISIKKKHPAIRYKYYILAGLVFVVFLGYVVTKSFGPQQLRYDIDRLTIATVHESKFTEFLNVEGVVQPILTMKLNALESGTVVRIIAQDGDMMKIGDTILILQNPELLRSVEEERDELEKKRVTFEERQIQMQRRTSELRRQMLQTVYNLESVSRRYELSKDEFNMGASSRAQLELAEAEYRFNSTNTSMLLEELRHDSLMNSIQTRLMHSDFMRDQLRFERIRQRLNDLTVVSPIDAQLSFVSVIPGERVGSGSNIGELKVIDQIKVTTRISEFYIDRVSIGLPATITAQGRDYSLRISRINPEVRDRQFAVDLVFDDDMPDNTRIGTTYRIQVEMGQPEDALVVSRGNFFQTTGGQWIFKLNQAGDKATKANLTIGRQNPQQYEIVDGLTAGDRVIISGYENFGDADEIILKKR